MESNTETTEARPEVRTVNVELTCPVSVIVNTDEGTVEKVIVWDELLDEQNVRAVRLDGYIPVEQKPGEPFQVGEGVFEELAEDDPRHARALEIVRGDEEYPAWQFGA